MFFGTSLGGICTMLLASTDADRIAGAMLNDIGPEIDPAGIERIGGYVGRHASFAAGTRRPRYWPSATAITFPVWTAERVGALRAPHLPRDADGIHFQYDMAIAENFRAATEGPPGDSWHLYRGARRPPGDDPARRAVAISCRGDRRSGWSTVLGEDAELVVVPDVGHTPNLEEPEVAGGDRSAAGTRNGARGVARP